MSHNLRARVKNENTSNPLSSPPPPLLLERVYHAWRYTCTSRLPNFLSLLEFLSLKAKNVRERATREHMPRRNDGEKGRLEPLWLRFVSFWSLLCLVCLRSRVSLRFLPAWPFCHFSVDNFLPDSDEFAFVCVNCLLCRSPLAFWILIFCLYFIVCVSCLWIYPRLLLSGFS